MDRRVLTLNFKDTLSALSDLMMPRVCLVCGRELTLREKLLCLPCSLDLPLTRFECLEHNPMADKYNARISVTPDLIGGLETRSEDNPSNGWNGYEPYQRATALLHYWHDSGYANIPQALKYERNFEAGRYFGSMLGKRLRSSPLFADVDLVVPVPLHWTRHLRRGYNQAEILARAIARELSAPGSEGDHSHSGRDPRTSEGDRSGSSLSDIAPRKVALAPRLLRRVRRTSTQTLKTIEQKTLNVSGAFTVRRNHIPPAHHILLVDDVFTTGSTLTECHNALRKVFGPDIRISLATLSYAG